MHYIEGHKREVWDVSSVIEIPSNLSEDDRLRLLDKRFENKTTFEYIGKKTILIDSDLYLFDSYSEASLFMREQRKLHYE